MNPFVVLDDAYLSPCVLVCVVMENFMQSLDVCLEKHCFVVNILSPKSRSQCVSRVVSVMPLSLSSECTIADQRFRLRFARGGTSSGEHGTFPVTNPATGAHIAEAADMSAKETTAAINTAAKAFTEWSQTPAKQRSALLRAWHDKVVENVDYLAALMTAEQGKPLAEAHGEVLYGASYLSWFSEEAKRIDGSFIQVSTRKPNNNRLCVLYSQYISQLRLSVQIFHLSRHTSIPQSLVPIPLNSPLCLQQILFPFEHEKCHS